MSTTATWSAPLPLKSRAAIDTSSTPSPSAMVSSISAYPSSMSSMILTSKVESYFRSVYGGECLLVGEVQNASRWYEQQRAGLGHALIGELEEWVAVALVRPNAETIVGATRRAGPHVRWSCRARHGGRTGLRAVGLFGLAQSCMQDART